jgi:septal ring factor EnvC (AmiA/AmiB activator)
LGAFLASIFAVAVPMFVLRLSPDQDASILVSLTRRWIATGLFGGTAIWWLISAFFVAQWVQKKGLDSKFTERLDFESTAKQTFWRKPHIAALLAPPAPAPDASDVVEPSQPQEYLEAITQTAEKLQGPAREAGRDAVATARDLLSAIESLDKQIAQFRENADRAEVDRIEEKLDDLGADKDGEEGERRQMRALLSKQLELARRLMNKAEESSVRRAHFFELIKRLLEELRSLHAATLEEELEAKQTIERIQSFRSEIKRYARDVAAISELSTLPK